MFALIDCNNFYASCETLFRPDLRGKPVVVLSNNDGCVVSRSAEAKAKGVGMAVPLFQIAPSVRKQLTIFSSNYPLYADMSARVMQTLQEMAPSLEIYSIDEAFMGLDGIQHSELTPFGHQVRARIQRDQGIPVCLGMAATKTLAKLANHAVKTWKATDGVLHLTQDRAEKLMKITPVSDIWGVGRRLAKKLNAIGVHTALDLARYPPHALRDQFSVVLERTARELLGESCLPMEQCQPARQQIVVSRSFGERVTRLHDMLHAVAGYATRAAEKLRIDHRVAGSVTVFMHTSPFDGRPRYSNSVTGQLPVPSADSRDIVALSRKLAESIWKEGFHYMKAGVMLGQIADSDFQQNDLFSGPARNPALMATIDNINRRGLGKTATAATIGARNSATAMLRQYLSPQYTTRWDEIPVLRDASL